MKNEQMEKEGFCRDCHPSGNFSGGEPDRTLYRLRDLLRKSLSELKKTKKQGCIFEMIWL